ncbi:hypothetical protein J2S43_008088 [Catenuloplanes nepalensis]|uniref:Lipoprotein n=1 Tax=Catenuloplanes nepalensis TaxID=587533 RepID=A0ABT9N854_9ACTN|nr:DUF6174 domain-containing protein [Catenuloplanes nepalensis]MDP9799576.1 hypothetical protein [Catenuloplanes nepalensis]
MTVRRWWPGMALLLLVGGCASDGGAAQTPAGPPSGVVSSSEKPQWSEPESYRFVLTTGCTRGFVDARYDVQVEGGRVVSATGLNEVATAHADVPVPTLGELDVWMRQAGGDERREWDPADGHPVAFGFEPDAMAVDAGRCYAVSDYQPRR